MGLWGAEEDSMSSAVENLAGLPPSYWITSFLADTLHRTTSASLADASCKLHGSLNWKLLEPLELLPDQQMTLPGSEKRTRSSSEVRIIPVEPLLRAYVTKSKDIGSFIRGEPYDDAVFDAAWNGMYPSAPDHAKLVGELERVIKKPNSPSRIFKSGNLDPVAASE